ncbi:hypothetical protein [Streptomyces sp. NPDC048521]|uniref:hypothetical protein n=1 Tax=Streptomyces sp. NPDC048521 TaxID=3365566 RepID=UPI003716A2E5
MTTGTPTGPGGAAPFPGQRTVHASRHTRAGLLSLSSQDLTRIAEDLDELGIRRPVPLRVRVALRRRAHFRRWTRLALMGLATLAVLGAAPLGWYLAARTGFGFPKYVPLLALYFPQDEANPLLEHDWAHLWPDWMPGPWATALNIALLAAYCGMGCVWLLAALVESGASRRTVWVSWFFVARRYALVMQCANVIHACAQARRTGGEEKAVALRAVSRRLKAVLRSLSDAHRSRGSVPRVSHRRKVLKRHARHVSAALRALDARLDHEPDQALRDLADALLTISDRYCHARLGALLDETALRDVQPLPDREVVRWLLALTVAVVAVTGLALMGVVPESAESIVYPLIVAGALTIAFGRNLRRMIEVLGVITGAP